MITLYSKPNCPHCVQSKNYLTTHGIDFTEVNVLESQEALDFIKARGHKTVPQIYVGESLLVEGGNSALQRLTPDEVRSKVTMLLT